jgi:hypothetical protein
MEIDIRRLLPKLHSLPVTAGEVGKNLADDERKELLHDAKSIRNSGLSSRAESNPE